MGQQTDQGIAHGWRQVFEGHKRENVRVGENTSGKERFFGGDTRTPPRLPHSTRYELHGKEVRPVFLF